MHTPGRRHQIHNRENPLSADTKRNAKTHGVNGPKRWVEQRWLLDNIIRSDDAMQGIADNPPSTFLNSPPVNTL